MHGDRLEELKGAWRAGRATLGAVATIPSARSVQSMARGGLDWILIDLEHGAVGLGAAREMIAATAATPLVPLVRVAAATPWQARMPLDLGALGVCFPMTTSRSAAEAVVRAVGGAALAIGTVEHILALDTIDEVVATPGLDMLFIGPGDLATSMGLRGRADHPDVCAAMRMLEAAVLGSPVVLGGVARTPDEANAMIARGYRALVIGLDWYLLARGFASALAAIRR
jgi:4-hydroxy-2-oxoheptanedioate aldolase